MGEDSAECAGSVMLQVEGALKTSSFQYVAKLISEVYYLKIGVRMTEQKPQIGKKGAGRKIAKKLGENRRKPVSQKILDIVNEISERERQNQKKTAKSPEAEL